MINLERFESINQIQAAPTVSSKYKFIPTTTALSVLAEMGWFPTKAMESKTRLVAKQGFQKHAIALSNPELNKQLSVGSKVNPQILLTNSHAGSSSFKLQLAMHVFLCSNGLVRASNVLDDIKVRHMGYEDFKLADATEKLALGVPDMMEEMEKDQAIILSPEERNAFAKAAIELRFDGDKYAVNPSDLLYTWRQEEKIPTLWNTFQVIQEKVIKGNVRQRKTDGSSMRSRAVKSIDENIKLNKALWTLKNEMAALKA